MSYLQPLFEHPELQKMMLVFARISGLLIFAPPFYNRRLSFQLKGGFAVFLTVAMYPAVRGSYVVLPSTFPDLGLALLYEMLIGFIIGFGVQILMTAFQLAGELIDREMGFAMANLVDPQTDLSVSILGSVLMNLGLFIFLDLDGHLWLIKTFAGSFNTMPLLDMKIHVRGLVWNMSEMFFLSIKFAVEISLPVVIIIQLIYLAQGFIQRTIPQLQIFVVGFIFTITVGLISVRLMLEQMATSYQDLIELFKQDIWFLVEHLRA